MKGGDLMKVSVQRKSSRHLWSVQVEPEQTFLALGIKDRKGSKGE